MLIKLRPVLQLLFLLVFIAVIATGRIQIWMGIFIGSFLLTFLMGRFFCGFICPINTPIEMIDWLYHKFGIKRRSDFVWLKKPVFKYAVFIIFLFLLVMFIVTGKKIPLLPVVALSGILLSLYFIPSFWHRYLCPFGTALTLPGCLSLYRLSVDYKKCNNCGICNKVCPGEAVDIGRHVGYPLINEALCLNCLACLKACPKEAIVFRRKEKSRYAIR